jgi:predicted dehydrogenase
LKEAGFHGVVLVEKPLFARNEVFDGGGFRKVLVGYNLRFHPLIKRLRELLGEEIVYSVQVYVGKNLAEWRPGSDYRKSYSAIQDQGGGVLRDLSHELDYLNWLLGGWKSVTAVGGHFSELEIETDDVFCLLMSMEACSVVQIQMNYLDMVGHRQIWINGKSGMIKADLMEGSLEINGHREEYKVERDFTYRAEHLAVLSQDFGTICSYEEGFEIIRLIESAERASKERIWVAR